MKKIIVILGPTASGKTDLSLFLAKKFQGYIISADSRQVYTGMNIGTAKTSEKERKLVPHYLIDMVRPDEDYTVSHFKKDSKSIIDTKQGLPFLVGGTGLYIDALVKNLNFPNIPPDKKLRHTLEQRIKKDGLKTLYKELITLDPDSKNIVDPKNPRRVIRALEVCKKSDKPFSFYYKPGEPFLEPLYLMPKISRFNLYKQINTRVDKMIEEGLIDETKELLKRYPKNLPALSSLGYKQLFPYLDGEIELDHAIKDIKKETRRYAKRQLTWFKRYKNVHQIKNKEEAVSLIETFLK
ncbi:tRNA (adenosine(37)-N6)-dimethylallyltransferase MiaA [Patescibacteria group bacterium]|nr:tRNA (adenosine(37)-N6)-dimethylallyltransferase MiaA [Patescibacteria group bacterium]